MLCIQYDLFQSKKESEFESLKKEFIQVKESTDRVRRGLFAKHSELAKEFMILKNEHENLIRSICRNETMFRPDRTEIRQVESIESSAAA